MFNRDLDELFNILMPHAVERLCYTGCFQPFGATVDTRGEITPNVAHIGGTAKPNRKQLEKWSNATEHWPRPGRFERSACAAKDSSARPAKARRVRRFCAAWNTPTAMFSTCVFLIFSIRNHIRFRSAICAASRARRVSTFEKPCEPRRDTFCSRANRSASRRDAGNG